MFSGCPSVCACPGGIPGRLAVDFYSYRLKLHSFEMTTPFTAHNERECLQYNYKRRRAAGPSATIIISLQSYFYYWYSIPHPLFHSRLKSLLFCESSLPQPFLCLLQESLYGFPRLFTATSEHIHLFTF